MNRQELMARLVRVQNQAKNQNRDIVSFAGFMDTIEELETYVQQQEAA